MLYRLGGDGNGVAGMEQIAKEATSAALSEVGQPPMDQRGPKAWPTLVGGGKIAKAVVGLCKVSEHFNAISAINLELRLSLVSRTSDFEYFRTKLFGLTAVDLGQNILNVEKALGFTEAESKRFRELAARIALESPTADPSQLSPNKQALRDLVRPKVMVHGSRRLMVSNLGFIVNCLCFAYAADNYKSDPSYRSSIKVAIEFTKTMVAMSAVVGDAVNLAAALQTERTVRNIGAMMKWAKIVGKGADFAGGVYDLYVGSREYVENMERERGSAGGW